jgi:hypothetical protein
MTNLKEFFEENKCAVIFLALSALAWLVLYNNKESFYLFPTKRPYRYCKDCGYKNRSSCSDCTNCGYCISSSGYGECTPGDQNGPYFRKDCMTWKYREPRYGAVHDYAYWYPGYAAGYPQKRKYGKRWGPYRRKGSPYGRWGRPSRSRYGRGVWDNRRGDGDDGSIRVDGDDSSSRRGSRGGSRSGSSEEASP